MGYWYPQVAVYDDVNGWVAEPYLLGAEFYMDPADYDVQVTVPRGWTVGATGTLQNAATILSRAARDSLARRAHVGADRARVITPRLERRARLHPRREPHDHLALQGDRRAGFCVGHERPLCLGRDSPWWRR